MKRALLINLLLTGLVQGLFGQAAAERMHSHGLLFLAGGRYDDLRMCVGSAAGVKGGPIGDIMFIRKQPLDETVSLVYQIPVMRPVLFGLAFDMLQFEPEVSLEYRKFLNEKTDLIAGPGLGVSFHYGPDYQSDLDNRGDSFFAMGPLVSWQTGIAFKREGKIKSTAAVKVFYVPLFSEERSTGTVLGGALLYSFFF